MGGVLSIERIRPWRTFRQTRQENLQFLNTYQTKNKKARRLRILLLGPIGAGKSSFINSVDSVFQNRMASDALTADLDGISCTRTYTTYKIGKDSENFCSFVLNDVMGLEATSDGGIQVDDLKLVLKGHVKDGYEFRPEQRIAEKDPGYNSTPTLEDRVHVLVYIIASDKIPVMADSVMTKMRAVRQAARNLRIPQYVVITKVDETCSKTKEDIKHAHRSKCFEEQVNKLSEILGVPQNCIFLVKNYNSEMQTNPDMSALILSALRRMVEAGEDFLNKQEDD